MTGAVISRKVDRLLARESRLRQEHTPEAVRGRLEGPSTSFLRDFIYGAIDGTVTTFAIVAGAAGASLGDTVIVIMGVANLVTDGFSMGVSNYLGIRAEQDERAYAGLTEEQHKSPVKAGLATFTAFIAVGTVPLLAFLANLASPGLVGHPFAVSVVLTGLAFLGVGVAKSLAVGQSWWKGGWQTVALGGSAAAVAYLIGTVLQGI